MRALAVLLLAATFTSVAAAAAGDPLRRHSRADMRIARAALLGAAELGGAWTPGAITTQPNTLTCSAFRPSLAGIVETGTAATIFRGTNARVVAQASWVYRTPAQARQLWSRVVRRDLLKCFSRFARDAGGGTVTRIQAGELAAPKIGERSAAYRVVVTAKINARTVRLYYDNFVLARGRAVTQLTIAAAQPIPAPFELSLGRAIAKRLGTPGVA